MGHGHREITRKSKHSLFMTQLLKWVGGTGTGSKYGAVYRDGSASVDPLHALVVDNSDEVWSVGCLDYLPSEGFGSDVVALDVDATSAEGSLCRRHQLCRKGLLVLSVIDPEIVSARRQSASRA